MTTATLCESCMNAQVPCIDRTCRQTTRFATWRQAFKHLLARSDPDERYLAQSTDHADFARRERIIEWQHEARLSRLRAGLWDFL